MIFYHFSIGVLNGFVVHFLYSKFSECLLSARHSSKRSWGHSSEQNRELCPRGADVLMRDDKNGDKDKICENYRFRTVTLGHIVSIVYHLHSNFICNVICLSFLILLAFYFGIILGL